MCLVIGQVFSGKAVVKRNIRMIIEKKHIGLRSDDVLILLRTQGQYSYTTSWPDLYHHKTESCVGWITN
jgi:hypothetical protein